MERESHGCMGTLFLLVLGFCMRSQRGCGKAAHALNQLAGFQFKECYSQPSHRPPTAVQALVIKRLEAAFEEAGPCPEGATPFSALQDLMRSHNLYEGDLYEGEPGNLASYDPDKLKILKSSGRPPSSVAISCSPAGSAISGSCSDAGAGSAGGGRGGSDGAPSDITLRFGNGGALTSKFALMLPAAGGTWVRIELGILLC